MPSTSVGEALVVVVGSLVVVASLEVVESSVVCRDGSGEGDTDVACDSVGGTVGSGSGTGGLHPTRTVLRRATARVTVCVRRTDALPNISASSKSATAHLRR
jgi:hypothetical protein